MAYRFQGVPGHSAGHSVLSATAKKPFFPYRYIIVLLCFLCTLIMYVERVGFSIAYTELASQAAVDESKKGFIMSVFFWGYGITQFPGAVLAQHYGGRKMLTLSFMCWTMASLCMPNSALKHYRMAAVRMVVGVAQGLIIPAVHSVVAVWIPAHERARAVSITTSGMYLGSTLAMVVLPPQVAALGPARVPRLVAATGLAWLSLWLLAGREHPQHTVHPASSSAGLAKGIAERLRTSGALLRSSAVISICINNFTFHYLIYVIMNWLPTYYTDLLGSDLNSLGLVAKAWPYMAIFLMSIAGGFAGDFLIERYKIPVGDARKLVNSIGFLATAACSLGMARAASVPSGIQWTMLTLGAAGFARGGFSVNHMDIGPRQASLIMGLSNTAGTIAGVIGVALTGRILDRYGGGSERAGWVNGLAVCSLLAVTGNLFFWWFARGERLFDDL